MSDGVAIETLSSTPVDSGFPAQGAVERPPFRAKTSFVVLCCAIVFYLALCYSLLHGELRATGTMTFPLDDTYITAQRLMAKEHLAVQVAGLLALVFFTPLHAIGVLGMEHTLHLALALLFLAAFSRVYAEQKFPGWGLLLLTALMVSARYEGLFFAAGAALLLMLERRVGAAFAVGAAAFVPVVGYGIISVMHGCYWLPHSIALKGISGKAASHSPVELLRHCATMLGRAPYLGALLGIVAVLLMIGTVRADRRRRALLTVAGAGLMLHLALADVGWVYRYEAYLIGTTIAVIACTVSAIDLREVAPRWAAGACVMVALGGTFLLYERTAEADATIPLRSLAIYCQQIQMAQFLRQFEKRATVGANDVGAINYFADIDCVDLTGLGDKEIFWLKRSGGYTTAAMADLAARRGMNIAIVYDSWFSRIKLPVTSGPPLPSSWIRVQRWGTPNGVFLGDGIVSFYAVDAASAEALRQALAQFDSTSLPRADVVIPD